MSTSGSTITVKLDSEEGAKITKALAAGQRVTMLGLLARRAMNVNEITAALGLSQPTVSTHIRMLEEAGLIECEHVSTGKGSEKRCWVRFDRLTLELEPVTPQDEEHVQEITMPVGLFTAVSVTPTCGLASDTRMIGFLDNPQSFLLPERAEAQILWFADGWVEYTFPCDLPPTAEITGIELMCEVCSEAPNYDNEWPSDITVWMNSVEVGAWTSPGDLGGARGRLNPAWWSDSLTQYGALKSWSVTASGSFIDGVRVGDTRLADLDAGYKRPITVRIGVEPDAVHRGGVNIFGRRFGSYPQDLTLRVRYRLRTSGQVADAVVGLLRGELPVRSEPTV